MELKRHGVSLISVLEYLDEDSPESVILESVLEAMAEYYSRNLARETLKGQRENALKGLHTGGLPPLGYDVDKATKKLVINEKEASAVRLIFSMFLEGHGYSRIIDELNAKAYITKKGTGFAKNSIHSVLRNEKYTGTYVLNKSASKDVDGKRNGHAYKTDDEIIRIEDAIPPIISKKDFEAVQVKMNGRKTTRAANTAKEVYLLSGKIFCDECEISYAGTRRQGPKDKRAFVTYRCNKKHSKRQCSNKEIKREHIEAFVLGKLSEYIFNDSLIPKLVSEFKRFQMEQNAEAIEARDNLKKRIRTVTKEIDNIVNVIAKTGSDTLVILHIIWQTDQYLTALFPENIITLYWMMW